MQLSLPSELTLAQASACLRSLSASLRGGDYAALVLDGSALVAFDSSALAVLLACQREALSLGKRLRITGLPRRLSDLARLYGILDVLGADTPAS